MENLIILDESGNGSFMGTSARYSYTPKLRARIDECFQAARRSRNRWFVLEDDVVIAAQTSERGASSYMNENSVMLQVRGCGMMTHVSGTNGGKMPCGAMLRHLNGVIEHYWCALCDPPYAHVQCPSCGMRARVARDCEYWACNPCNDHVWPVWCTQEGISQAQIDDTRNWMKSKDSTTPDS